jgi:hypothetical protein
MKEIVRIVHSRVSTENVVLGLVQWSCYAAGVAVLILALNALARMVHSRELILIGVLAASGLAVSLVTMGLVIGVIAQTRRGE